MVEASFARRATAYLIDQLVVIALVTSIGLLPVWPGFSGVAAGLGVGFAYALFRDSLDLLQSQSIGKKMLNIIAVTEAGKPLSQKWTAGLVRNAVLFIPFFPLMEFVTLLNRNGKPEGLRRLGDEWAGTIVVERKRR